MLVDYSVTEMVWFDDYLDAVPRSKKMRVNGITPFIFHVAQCITFHRTIVFTETLIAKAFLKSFYSRLGFKIIKDFLTSHNFKKDRSRKSHVETVNKEMIGISSE